MNFRVFHSINYITKYDQISLKWLFYARVTIVLSFVLSSFLVQAQSQINPGIFLPSLDSLKASCINFYKKQAVADLHQYNYKTKGQVLNFLPSPGWNFATQSPILTVSFADVFRAVNTKRTNKAQSKRIVLSYEAEMNAALIEVVQLHASLANQLNLYNSSLEILELEKQKFSIIQKDFDQSIIPPSQYLAAQISFANLSNNLNQKLYDLYRSRSELLIKAKKGDWVSLPDGLLSLSNNLQAK